MPVTVVVGGQFGSEGKGKVAHAFARNQRAAAAIRVGGSNSGHTVIDPDGNPRIFRHLPTAAVLSDVTCVIGPGSYVDPEVLISEIEDVRLSPERLLIDQNAVLITEEHKDAERRSGLREKIGSTGSGTGAAVIDRISRGSAVAFAGTDERLARFVVSTRPFLRELLNRRERIVVEGTQGFGLSLLHSGHHPKVTSRDTTAAAFVSEAGLSPRDVDEIVLVIRAFPIRVAGDSGPLPNETTWEAITRESGSPVPIVERSSVTKEIRRVARFDPEVVLSALEANDPTCIVLNHLDYVDSSCRQSNILTKKAENAVAEVESGLSYRIRHYGFGPASIVASDNFDLGEKAS